MSSRTKAPPACCFVIPPHGPGSRMQEEIKRKRNKKLAPTTSKNGSQKLPHHTAAPIPLTKTYRPQPRPAAKNRPEHFVFILRNHVPRQNPTIMQENNGTAQLLWMVKCAFACGLLIINKILPYSMFLSPVTGSSIKNSA